MIWWNPRRLGSIAPPTSEQSWKQRALEAEAKIEGLEKLVKEDSFDGLQDLMKLAMEKVSLLSGLHSAALAREAVLRNQLTEALEEIQRLKEEEK